MKMNGEMKKKATLTSCTSRNQDRISSLPDQLLHHILSFSDAHLAVQTSVLSKRWKLVWTTLPFLNFTRSRKRTDFTSDIKFIDKFFSRRNHDSDVLKFNLFFFHFSPEFRTPLVDKFINYAISHNVRDLNVDVPGVDYIETIKLSRPNYLTSTTIKKLILNLPFGQFLEKNDSCWRLPALTTLHLIRPLYSKPYKLPESYLVCLPSLRTLLLDGFELPSSFSLPALQTLILHTVEFPENMSEFCRVFQAFGNLRNLTLFFWTTLRADCVIDCPQLVNLEINYCTSKTGKSIVTSNSGEIKVLAPKILSFTSVGIFPISFGILDQLENVNIQLHDSAGIQAVAPTKTKEIFYEQVTNMFRRLEYAKVLTLDMKTIEALSALSDILVRYYSPFFSLKYVKVPHGFKESSMSPYLKCFLLGNSREATIVTTLPRVHREIFVDNSMRAARVCKDMGVQEERVVQNADRVTQIRVPVEGTVNDRMSFSRRDSEFGLWRGHEVSSEFVGLLDIIMNKYPETFEHFTTTNKKLCTMKLNTLCTSVNDFTKISMTDVDMEMIAEYRDVFSGLQKFGFNVSWLVRRLNYIEQLRFSQPLLPELHAIDCNINAANIKLQDLQIQMDDTKIKLHDLQSLRAEKMKEIHEAFGPVGSNLAVGYIGDDLLPGS